MKLRVGEKSETKRRLMYCSSQRMRSVVYKKVERVEGKGFSMEKFCY